MNSRDMPNTLSMYDTLSCVFVFVSLRGPRGAAVVSETGDTNGRTDGWGWRMAAA